MSDPINDPAADPAGGDPMAPAEPGGATDEPGFGSGTEPMPNGEPGAGEPGAAQPDAAQPGGEDDEWEMPQE